MPRVRRAVDSDDDSSKENQEVPSTIPKSRLKVEKGARATGTESRVDSDEEENKGPTQATNYHGNGNVDVDGDEEEGQSGQADEDEDENDSDEEGSPNGKKRTRLNEDGAGVPVKEEKPKIRRRVTLPRDKDGYVPGSIVRVQLKNFVTYDFVEFRPGPRLNMIFGPNGTGKSTIACAICLGLNGTPALLGRQAELSGFVKMGHEDGYVELEVKGKLGTPNLVIRRLLTARSKGSRFTLNGRAVTGADINQRLVELNVQVSNLCSFLPQDRVVEFAKMNPQELLKETQRCAGDENLTTWHQDLIGKGRELKTIQTEVADEAKRIHQLQERQKTLEKDVRRYRERREIEKQIELLEIIQPFIEYKESKAVYDAAKEAKTNAAIAYKQLEEQNRPLKTLQSELKEQLDELEQQRTALKEKVKTNYNKHVNAITRSNKAANKKAEDAIEDLKQLKLREKTRVQNIAKAKEKIDELQKKVDNPPEIEDLNALGARLKVLNTQGAEWKVKRQQYQNQIEDLANNVARNQEDISDKQKQLDNHNNVIFRKIKALGKWDSNCAEVAEWLVKEKAKGNAFANRVDLPAYLDMSLRDPKYANAIEACMNANQMKTFITHSEEDYSYFNRIFIDTNEALGKKVRVTVWYRPVNEATLVKLPLSTEELHKLGFQGYALDFVECSRGLKWFLAKELNMHRTPITLDEGRVNDDLVQSYLCRAGPDGRFNNANYISGMTLLMVSRSSYGQQKTMTVTRNIRPARNLNSPAADPTHKRDLEGAIETLQKTSADLDAQIKSIKVQDDELVAQMNAMKPEHTDIKARIEKAQSTQRDIVKNHALLNTAKEKLRALEKQPSSEQERKKLTDIIEKTVKERTKLLAEFVDVIQTVIKDQSTLASISLRHVQLAARVSAIDTLCSERSAHARRVKQEYEAACTHFDESKADSRRKMDIITAKLAEIDEELREQFKEMDEEDKLKNPEDRWTSEKVAAALETERAKLDLNHATDAGVIALFEQRETQIKNLERNFEAKQSRLEKLQRKIKKTKDLWYPALTGLIGDIGARFSAAFDRIKCAGEIRLAEHEDYDKWCIDIFVKFRDKEQLAQLTGQRQSGGERALSTILYLMSLVEHARAPFSLVDEINQGMDHHYERMVHDQLVEVTCKPESGQYFLITPKLLPELRYHESMKILCVNNGEWLPEATGPGVGSMKRMIDAFVARRPVAAAA